MGCGLAVCGMRVVYAAPALLAWPWRQAGVGQGTRRGGGGAVQRPFPQTGILSTSPQSGYSLPGTCHTIYQLSLFSQHPSDEE